jgi:hypothetical protein
MVEGLRSEPARLVDWNGLEFVRLQVVKNDLLPAIFVPDAFRSKLRATNNGSLCVAVLWMATLYATQRGKTGRGCPYLRINTKTMLIKVVVAPFAPQAGVGEAVQHMKLRRLMIRLSTRTEHKHKAERTS